MPELTKNESGKNIQVLEEILEKLSKHCGGKVTNFQYHKEAKLIIVHIGTERSNRHKLELDEYEKILG